MQVTNFTSGKVPKLKRLLCERCSYVPCPSNVLCNFPSSKLFSTLDEVSENASLFLTYNIIHCTLQHTAISYMIHIAVYKYEVFNVSEKWSQKKCRGLLSIVTKWQTISPIAKQCANYKHHPLQPLHWWLPKKIRNLISWKQNSLSLT